MSSLTRALRNAFILTTAILVQSFPVHAQSAEAKTKATGSISGRVTVDGKPAVRIPIAAVPGQSVNRRDAPARGVSDVEGKYQISGLSPGEYQVWTLTPALIAEPTAYPNYFPYAGTAKSIILGTGENVTDLDLKLIRGAVISGRVTNADNKLVVEERIKLQVLDANGNPRFGALYSSYDQMYQTDDRGVYRIFDLAPGRYRVSVGYDAVNDGILRGRRYDQISYLDPNDQSKPGIVELTEGDEARNIDIRVGKAAGAYSVSGRVIDSKTGIPIAKAGVSFDMLPKDQGPPIPGFMLQTDERGEFSYSGFAPGRYAITANSEYYSGNFYGGPVYFDLIDKDVTGLELKTVAGLGVSGNITADGLSTKELMSLLRNLVIVASGPLPANNRLRSRGRTVVAQDGTFQIDGLRTGPTSLFISTQRPAFIRTNINRMERDGVAVNQNFDLKESLSGLHVVIDYGTGTIRGTVKFEGGPAITESRMYVNCKREGSREGNGVEVDARGHFVITNLPPGPTEVTLQVNALTPRPPGGIPLQKQIVNVANGSETEVTFVVHLPSRQGVP